jgi:hypothetical protein
MNRKMYRFNSDEEMIKTALDKVGYGFMEPSEENLRECFDDFVSCGVWSDLRYDDEDINEIPVKNICRNLWNL